MSSFHGQNLLGSGPHRTHAGGLALRHVLQAAPGSAGVQLSAQGCGGRTLTQRGVLLADDLPGLQQQISAIEAAMDGQAHELVDERARRWPHTVLLSLELRPITRVGTRWRVAYRLGCLQVIP